MKKLLEIGEIGLLRDIPSELTIMTNENNLLKQNNSKLRFEKRILIFSMVALVLYIIWSGIKKKDEKAEN
jgi:hypothetical protein